MQVICSWCRREGRLGLVGEKPPLEDRRETHSICMEHEQAVRARWVACRGSLGGTHTTSRGDTQDRTPCISLVIRSVVRLYSGLKGLSTKNRL